MAPKSNQLSLRQTDIDFAGWIFPGDAGFGEAQFHGAAGFEAGRNFTAMAGFGGAQFHGDAGFGEAQFHGDAGFGEAQFHGEAGFAAGAISRRCQVRGGAISRRCRVRGGAISRRCRVRGRRDFMARPGSGRRNFTANVNFFERRSALGRRRQISALVRFPDGRQLCGRAFPWPVRISTPCAASGRSISRRHGFRRGAGLHPGAFRGGAAARPCAGRAAHAGWAAGRRRFLARCRSYPRRWAAGAWRRCSGGIAEAAICATSRRVGGR